MTVALSAIEQQLQDHVAKAIAAALESAGYDVLTMNNDIIPSLAEAALSAVNRFPEAGYPFGRDLNMPPARLHPSIVRALSEIDAGVFSGDSFSSADANLFLSAHAQRWSRAMRLARIEARDLEGKDPEILTSPE